MRRIAIGVVLSLGILLAACGGSSVSSAQSEVNHTKAAVDADWQAILRIQTSPWEPCYDPGPVKTMCPSKTSAPKLTQSEARLSRDQQALASARSTLQIQERN
jgi:hypothetical protein